MRTTCCPVVKSARRRVAGCLLSATVLLLALPGPASAAPVTPSFGKAIEALTGYAPQSTCSPTAKTGTVALRELVTKAYPGTGDLGIVRDCAAVGTSEHKEGRAWDWGINAFDAEQDAQANDLFEWLLADDAYGNGYAMARRLGVMYMIYNSHIWSAYNAAAGWRPYLGSNPHTDHVHVSLSWPSAEGNVSFWGKPVVTATPTPTGTASPRPSSTPTPTGSPTPTASGSPGVEPADSPITARWQALGGPLGPLGAAVGVEHVVPGGREQDYVDGSILWSSATGAHAVYGDIGRRYAAVGGPDSALGLPTTDELAAGATGRVSVFQGGRFYWALATGTRAVTGPVLANHDAYGGAAGPLGLPVGELEKVTDRVQQQLFAGGQVSLRAGLARHVRGMIRDRYLALGGPSGRLGVPVSDEYDVPGGRRSDFDGGQLTWNASSKAVSGP